MTEFGGSSWLLGGATRDQQSITSDWQSSPQNFIDGVRVKEVTNVCTSYGILTEIYRSDWVLDGLGVDQVFRASLAPGRFSAWHAHEHTTDRLFVIEGIVLTVLYDGRPDSPTRGMINEFRTGALRPTLIRVPPKVWHGIQNISIEQATVLNLVDRAYQYEAPDHWRLPPDSPEIPYQFC
ncbi:MAG: dTDP-4-dehydrorhamnose 3,5-epimerase family protein [Candidatus Hydrogenedentes bacterium]|nr:dTDP-4-dehydrorhamnose 3,5-epimerase family protein [Candidatus Hydrogenedentota bacterium]